MKTEDFGSDLLQLVGQGSISVDNLIVSELVH